MSDARQILPRFVLHNPILYPLWHVYIYISEVGGRPLPGNRFVSFVRAYGRCPLPSGNAPQTWCRAFPFSLSAQEASPFPLRSKVKSKWTLCEIQCELKVNSKWKQCEILPLPQSSYPALASFIGVCFLFITRLINFQGEAGMAQLFEISARYPICNLSNVAVIDPGELAFLVYNALLV